ncbi:hypothetical protein BP6252_06629 [Coleophoma cylindrospora]|uniref:ABC1 atypical kinase-like domain-containing protein n=1 Tax=Coleophoma cylindrospora TaxID=1849047 RepID=A0A3D8RN44_9HELO|nr:hypothetical protein BP6252_06629 [Coleophoma cylindrospora]
MKAVHLLQRRICSGRLYSNPQAVNFAHHSRLPLESRFPAGQSILPIQLRHSVANFSTLSQWASVANPFPRPKSPPKKPRKLWMIILIVVADLVAVEQILDHFMFDRSIERSLRAFRTLGMVGLDYKLHGGPNSWLSRVDMEILHRRNAQRVCDMLKQNGGLYVKSGQALATQDAMLPDGYQRMFDGLFDNATQSPFRDVEKVIKDDFGCTAAEMFGPEIEHEARASASIAQVHYAKLPDGREVAVKVQRREVKNQLSWDLWTLKVLLDYTARSTGLQLQKVGAFVMDRMMLETDFQNEASNSERMADLIASDPQLRERVYIPKVFHELSSKRILTTEWINGKKLWDKEGISAPVSSETSQVATSGLGLNLGDVMETVIELFSVQMFQWGFVHCDPNPGNLFVRRLPSGKPQVVLIDHGLYITLSDKLRRQYARFWKGLITNDTQTLDEVSQEWGMSSSKPWADVFLMRLDVNPDIHKPSTEGQENVNEADLIVEEVAGYLGDVDVWPQELVFLERTLELVQGHNQYLGSPVNRIKMIGRSAMYALRQDKGYQQELRQSQTIWQSLQFQWTMFALDLAFWMSRLRQLLGFGGGFEDDMKEAEEKAILDVKGALGELFGD